MKTKLWRKREKSGSTIQHLDLRDKGESIFAGDLKIFLQEELLMHEWTRKHRGRRQGVLMFELMLRGLAQFRGFLFR